MQAQLATALAELEALTAETRGLVRDWPIERLAWRATPDEWSACEVFDHLERVERGITAAARRGLRTPHRIGFRDQIGVYVIDRIFRTPRRVQVPGSAAQVLPDRGTTLPEVDARWSATRIELVALLETVTGDQLRAGVFRHPVGGWMTMPQVLRFFTVHLHHHRYQLDRLAASSASA